MRVSAGALGLLLAGCQLASSAKPQAQPAAAPPQPSTTEAATKVVVPLPSVAAAPATTIAPAASAPANAVAAPSPSFAVRYPCDDKYDGDATCRPGKAAWSVWLEAIDLSAAAANLLNHQGGGPSGAEWNPAAPLVAFVASGEPGRARLKSSRATFTPVARFANYDVFIVRQASWQAAARRARAADFPEGTALDPLSVVELWTVGGQNEQRGSFAFSRGE